MSSKSVNSSRFWFVDVASLSFADKPSLEVALFLESSNYISNIGTGTREGYYLSLCAANQCHSVGLASEGYNINTISVPDHPLTPFAIAGEFHVYRVAVDSSGLSLSIDGQAVASGVTPESTPASNRIEFGGGSGASRNVSLLAWACVRTTND